MRIASFLLFLCLCGSLALKAYSSEKKLCVTILPVDFSSYTINRLKDTPCEKMVPGTPNLRGTVVFQHPCINPQERCTEKLETYWYKETNMPADQSFSVDIHLSDRKSAYLCTKHRLGDTSCSPKPFNSGTLKLKKIKDNVFIVTETEKSQQTGLCPDDKLPCVLLVSF